eukprot:gene7448-9540_t
MRPEVVAEYNKWRQVFRPEDWEAIQEELKRAPALDPSVVYRRDMDVLQNDFCGVRPYKANILFVFNGKPVPDWSYYDEYKRAAEPSTTIDTYFRAKDFDKSFPFIPFGYLSFTESLAERLVDNTYFNLNRSLKLDEFLADVRNSNAHDGLV